MKTQREKYRLNNRVKKTQNFLKNLLNSPKNVLKVITKIRWCYEKGTIKRESYFSNFKRERNVKYEKSQDILRF